MAKILTPELADPYFQRRGVKLGVWNGLEFLHPGVGWIRSSFCTGKSVYELINLSQHVAGWLSKGSWKILQIDNSSYFFADQSLLLSSLLLGPSQCANLTEHRTFLFEFGDNQDENFQTEVVLAHLINLMLVYEAHCYLLSSEGSAGEMLAMQDGFVYFYGSSVRLAQAEKFLNEIEAGGSKAAQWIDVLNADEQ